MCNKLSSLTSLANFNDPNCKYLLPTSTIDLLYISALGNSVNHNDAGSKVSSTIGH